MRLYELARELQIPPRVLMRSAGLRSHLATLNPDVEADLRAQHPTSDRPTLPLWGTMKRRPGPKPISFRPDFDDDYYDPYRDLEYVREWSTRDVAFYFSVSIATVRQWVKRGHLAPARFEKRTHVFSSAEAMTAGLAISRRTNAPPGMRANILPKHHDRYVTSQLAAAAVGVAPSTVRSWIHRGRLTTKTSSAGRVTVRVGDVFTLARTSRHRRRT